MRIWYLLTVGPHVEIYTDLYIIPCFMWKAQKGNKAPFSYYSGHWNPLFSLVSLLHCITALCHIFLFGMLLADFLPKQRRWQDWWPFLQKMSCCIGNSNVVRECMWDVDGLKHCKVLGNMSAPWVVVCLRKYVSE